jgi:hypothetical protein
VPLATVALLEVTDIQRLRIECRTCHAALLFSLDSRLQLPQRCPGCQEFWDQSNAEQAMAAIARAINALRVWRDAVAEFKPPFTLRIELSEDAPKPPQPE